MSEPSAMELVVNRETLKFACGRSIFCGCGAVLDCRRAVLLTNAAGVTAAACASCYDRVAGRLPADLEVLDGRELFKRQS